jgi:glycosyltransferase involved in cell wall biosynthesis
MPTVTAIVPNYNHRRYLEQRIQSVLNQTYPHLEVLLLDDASTDGSRELLENFSSSPRVTGLLVNEANSGTPFKQWNKGVAAATGEYIWIAESDDYANPTLVNRLVDILERHPNVGVAYAQSVAVDEQSNPLYSLIEWTRDLHPTRWESDYLSNGREECRNFTVRKCTIPNASGAIFRRALYHSVGGADETYKLSGDWQLWGKLLLVSDIAFVSEPLNFFRTHAGTVRKQSSRGAIGLLEAIRVLDYFRSRVVIPDDIYQDACDRLLGRWVGQLSLGRLQPRVNMQILRQLHSIDSQLRSRLLHRIARKLRKLAHSTNHSAGLFA